MYTIEIDQSVFIRDLVIKERLTDYNAKLISIKVRSIIKMIDLEDYEETELREYQYLISKLIYLACGTRPDIALIVGQLSKHNADPKKDHLRIAKRVVSYLKGTMQIDLIFGQANIIG